MKKNHYIVTNIPLFPLKNLIFGQTLFILLLYSTIFSQSNTEQYSSTEYPGMKDDYRGLVLGSLQQNNTSIKDSNTTLIGRWVSDSCYAVAVSNDIAYFGNGKYFRVLDVSDKANPIELGKLLTPSTVKDIAVGDNYVYVADWHGGLRIIDVSTPSNPTEVGFFDDINDIFLRFDKRVTISGGYAYVLREKSASFRIIDVATPSNPTEVGFFHNGTFVLDVAVINNYAYVIDWYARLHIIDVSTPSAPTEVGFFDTPGQALGVDDVRDHYIYVASSQGLRIIDISTPSKPEETGFIDISNSTGIRSSTESVAVDGNFVYMADRENGLHIIDVSSPSSPTLAGFFDTGGSLEDVAVDGNYAYVADKDSGIYIIRNDLLLTIEDESTPIPKNFMLDQNYPNPFNPVTTIQYHLPKSSFINLSIYNVAGQLIETLVNGYKGAGSYEVQWNAHNFSSGVYFYRISTRFSGDTGEYSETKKSLILK